jgi:WXG100 family type VII secretion target
LPEVIHSIGLGLAARESSRIASFVTDIDLNERGAFPMAQTTQAQQAELVSAARRFEDVNGELQSMLKTLLDELSGLRDGWQGAGGRSFEAVKEAWSRDQAALHKNLLETAEAIKSSGQNYTVTDTDASHRMNATSAGGRSLPL